MTSQDDFNADHVFDGGSIDCGSGLILLIRQNMLHVPAGGLLEIRSTEPTVESELPPWCRMVGHTHVGSDEVSPGEWRHFVQRNEDATPAAEVGELKADKEKAQAFKWSVRARRSDSHETTIYSRNFSWKSGASLGFDRSAALPTALEQLLGSLLADVVAGFATQCSQRQILIDEFEATVNTSLHNTLAAVGVESGDASINTIALVMFTATLQCPPIVQKGFAWLPADVPAHHVQAFVNRLSKWPVAQFFTCPLTRRETNQKNGSPIVRQRRPLRNSSIKSR